MAQFFWLVELSIVARMRHPSYFDYILFSPKKTSLYIKYEQFNDLTCKFTKYSRKISPFPSPFSSPFKIFGSFV